MSTHRLARAVAPAAAATAAWLLQSRQPATASSDVSGYVRPDDARRFVAPLTKATVPLSFVDKWEAWAHGPPPPGPALAAALARFEGNAAWARVDDVLEGSRSSAISGSLGVRAKAIPLYRMYLKRDGSELAVVALLGDGTSGHGGILHGGITSLLFDEALGWANAAARLAEVDGLALLLDPSSSADLMQASVATFGFTAFLHVDFKRPLLLASRGGDGVVVLTCRAVKSEGRKMFVEGAMAASDGSAIAAANALFVRPRQ